MMNGTNIYNDKWNDVGKEVQRVKDSSISEGNKDFILRYHNHLQTVLFFINS